MMLGKRNSWLLLTLLLVLCSEFVEARSGQYSIQFKEHLKLSSDLRLNGVYSSRSLRFNCEATWKPAAGSTLHLFIEHSPNIDGSRSYLSITLNYGVLRSLRLDNHNQSLTEITIPLPPGMLRPENEILFSVEQFPATQGSGTIWTAIKPSSFISIQYEENQPTLDLRELPSPLLDPRSYRPKQLSVLLPNQPSLKTLEGTALLIANYSARLEEALTIQTVRSIDEASHPLLIVGTPDELPIRQLQDQLPFELVRVGNKTRLGGSKDQMFPPQEGVVALLQKPSKTFHPILLVTGNGPDGVMRAVRKLIGGAFEEAGPSAKITEDVPIPPLPSREWRGFLPPVNHFTLDDMGLTELKIDSQNGFSVSLPFLATPDTEFLGYGHQMTLRFRFSSDVNLDNATLDVDLNGTVLSRFDAADFGRGSRTSVQLKVPARVLRGQNLLKLRWQGLGDTSDPAVWLLPTSEFNLPRDYRWNLPDLGLLRYGLFPFSLQPDLSDTILVVPDDLDAHKTAAIFEFAGLLGRLVPADRFAFGLKPRRELNRGSRLPANVIELRVGDLPEGRSARGLVAVIQEGMSLWNPDRHMLTVTAPSASALQAAIKTVFSEAVLKELSGDTTYVYSNRVSSFRAIPLRETYEYSYFTHLQSWLRENWIALPVILTTVSFVLFVGLRIALAHYKIRKTA